MNTSMLIGLVIFDHCFPNHALKEHDIFISADDGWSDWSDWSQCDTPCGEGSQLSSRICYNSMFGSEKCTGDSFRLQNCSSYFCQGELSIFPFITTYAVIAFHH